jgi:peptidyl-prolyl cis-trans isomerase D
MERGEIRFAFFFALKDRIGNFMFEFIRTHNRLMQIILLLLIVPSFFLVGVSSYSSFVNREPELARVGNDAITQTQFDAARRDQLDRAHQQIGADFDPAQVDTPVMRQGLMDQLINQRLLARVAADNRFSVSDETLRSTIASIDAVQENGHFSPERYRQVLAAQGMTPATFETGLRGDLAVGRVMDPIGQSARVPDEVVNDVLSAVTQVRTVQWRRFSAADFRSKVTVTPADIQTWYDANKAQLQIPESVSIDYLLLDEAAATAGIQVKDDDIQKYYEQNKTRFGQPERRHVSHILVQLPPNATQDQRTAARQKADDIAKQAAAKPDKFADLARAKSEDPGSSSKGGDLGWIGQGQFPAALDSVIFALKDKGVTGVVESPAGFHVFDVTQIDPASIKPVADVKAQITTEIRKQLAADRFATMATSLTRSVNDQRDSLQPAADAAGLTIKKATGITRTGLLAGDKGGPNPAAASPDADALNSPRVRQTLFSSDLLRDKFNSGVIELAPDKMVAVRVNALVPASIPPLSEVEDHVRTVLIDQRSAAAAVKAGEDALAALSKDPAASLTDFTPPKDITRQNPDELSRSLVDAIFRTQTAHLPTYTGLQEGSDYVVARLEKVDAGKMDATQTDALRKQVTSAWAQAEQDAVVKTLRDQYKVKIEPAAQRIIRGDNPAQG